MALRLTMALLGAYGLFKAYIHVTHTMIGEIEELYEHSLLSSMKAVLSHVVAMAFSPASGAVLWAPMALLGAGRARQLTDGLRGPF